MPDLRQRLRLSADYEIEHELGHGGMAVVFLAHDHKHKRKVAITILKVAHALSSSSTRHVPTLAEALKGVDEKRIEALYRELQDRRQSEYVPASAIGSVAFSAGRVEEGIDWLECAYEERDAVLIAYNMAASDPSAIPAVLNHPRLLAPWRKMGMR